MYKAILDEHNMLLSVFQGDSSENNWVSIDDYDSFQDKLNSLEEDQDLYFIENQWIVKDSPEIVYEKYKALQYLESTDWIVTKIAEANIEGLDITDLKAKYTNELYNRKVMRESINKAEAQ